MNRRHFGRTLAGAAVASTGTFRWLARNLPAAATGAVPHAIRADRLRANLEALARFGRTPKGGITRVAWTPPDAEARRFVMGKIMAAAGLNVRIDPAGSIIGRRPGREDLPVILFGSHIDTVPEGGMFDGALGSLAAVEVVQTLADQGIETRHPMECVIWSNEEGAHYGRGLFGSRAVVGEFEPGELDEKDEQGLHIRDAVASIGGDLSRIKEALRKPGDIAAYLELHVEQGGVLDKAGIPIGVVEGIVGIVRYRVVVTGQANHAGTTPMPDRHDALITASRLVVAVSEETMREPGRQVGTVGKLAVHPDVPNIIPGSVELVIELRDLSMAKINGIIKRIEARAGEFAASSGTTISIEPTSTHQPALATPWLRDVISKEAAAAGLKSLNMPSGAGHDAQMIARIAPMGMIFVPSVDGISHSPRELTRWEDTANGCEVLYRAVLAIDRR